MSLWTSLEPASATVDPGGSTSVRLRLRNTGDVVDEYRFVPVGDLTPWTAVEPQVLRLYPGTTGTVELTFAPPRTPDAAAGPHPYAVQIIPTQHPEATTVPEGNITVTPFTEVRAELVPPSVKGRFRGRPKLAVDNFGNVKLTASVNGSDNGDQISYDIHPANVQIEPGRAAFVKSTLKPRRIIWAGAKQSRPFTLSVLRSGAEPLPVRGTYVQPGLMPRWFGVLLSMLFAFGLAFLMIWLAYKPQVGSMAQEVTQEAAATSLPTTAAPTTPPAALTSPPATTPVQEPTQPTQSAAGSGGAGGGAPHKAKPKEPGYKNILIQNGTTGKCLDLPGAGKGSIGRPVNQFTCFPTDKDNQVWNIELLFKGAGPGGADLFQIRNVKDGYCADLKGQGSDTPGTHVVEGACTDEMADNQTWWLEKRTSTGLYWLHNYTSNNLCLDVSGFHNTNDDMANNDTTGLYTCSDTDDQGWSFLKLDES
jgi:hypothetical protein